ncbi:TPA: hypothetical protein ACGTQW_004291 [Escherichia coli]|nr:hypothetical protein [Escherichia coli]HAV7542380.1 hypothetical protein [Escherichia coli]
MINYFECCSTAISSYLIKNKHKKVWLPEDICSSLTSMLNKHDIEFDFFPIKRGWGEIDKIDLSMIPQNEFIIVSDLFNFRGIDIRQFINRKFALDLAHCSIDTARYYMEKIKLINQDVCFFCISMGKGKYYRFGGGGVLIENESYFAIDNLNFPEVKYLDIPLHGIKFKSTSTSSRMVVSADKISNIEIERLRQLGVDISDGLYSHISKKSSNEYFVWKECKQ